MTVKYFDIPFATDGDVLPVPDAPAMDGSLSYTQGYDDLYQLNLATDPAALAINRQQYNQVMNDITGAIQQLQQWGVPQWFSALGASPGYAQYAIVRYTDGHIYESQINTNTDTPGTTDNWIIVDSSVNTGTPPAGTGALWYADTPPVWALECNGASLLRASYADLFAVIGTTFGSVDGTHFTLPDLRGQFLRGWDDSRGVDPARAFGSLQGFAMQGHYHGPLSGAFLMNSSASPIDNTEGGGNISEFSTTAGPVSDGTHGTPQIASETRPTNVAAMYIIAF